MSANNTPTSAAPEDPSKVASSVICNDGVSLSATQADESAIGIHLSTSGSYSTDLKKPRPTYTPPFIRRNAGSPKDDPFATPTNKDKHRGRSPPTIVSSDKKRAMTGQWRINRSASGSSSNSETDKKTPVDALIMGVGSVNLEKFIQPEDPQSIYKPDACAFVANLLQSETDESLLASVTAVFRRFGKVWVKIRRDAQNMPFAFVQYEHPHECVTAIKDGCGLIINGRACRTEKAKAQRIYYIERKSGAVLTTQDAREIMGAFGDINFCRLATEFERADLGVNNGVVVEFSFYWHGQDAFNSLKNSEVYKIVNIAAFHKEKGSGSRKTPTFSPEAAAAFMIQYDLEKRSVWVGNLREGIPEDEIRQLFQEFGTIVSVEIYSMDSKFNADEKLSFAYVEFRHSSSTNNAINIMNGYKKDGRSIKVSQRDTDKAAAKRSNANSTRRITRVRASPAVARTQSAVPGTPTPAPGHASSAGSVMIPNGYGITAFPGQYSNPGYHAGYATPSPNWMYDPNFYGPAYNTGSWAYTTPPYATSTTPGNVPPSVANASPYYHGTHYPGQYGPVPAYTNYAAAPFYGVGYPASPPYQTYSAQPTTQVDQNAHAHPQSVEAPFVAQEKDRSATPTPASQSSATVEVTESESA